MPSKLNFIFNVDDPEQNGLLDAFLAATPGLTNEQVRGDKAMAIVLRPVHVSETINQEVGARPWDDDHESGDTYKLGIGNADEPPSGGTFTLTIGATTIAAQTFTTTTAATLTTALSAASVTAGYGTLVVTMPATGVFVATWTTAGSAVPALTASATGLTPYSEINISRIYVGDETPTTYPQQTIVLRQQLVALSEPATALTAAGVTRSYDQAMTALNNSIVRIAFNAADTYGGLYSIVAVANGVTESVGQIGPMATPQELGILLGKHSEIFYQSPTGETDNIATSQDGQDYIIEFLGDLSGTGAARTISDATVANPTVITTSADHNWNTGDSITITNSTGITPSLNGTHTFTRVSATTGTIPVNVTVSSGESATAINNSTSLITVANVSLLAPVAVSGALNLNTYNLASAFWNSTEDTLEFKLSIERTRSSGEIRTLLLVPVVLKRDIIDVTSLVPVSTSGGIYIGKMLFVDSVYGLDSNDGTFARPKLTPAAAQSIATSGTTIHVFPGSYTCSASLAKAGVNWYFAPGATVTMTDTAAATGIWDDGGTSMTFKVAGMGDFVRTSTSGTTNTRCILVSHASSVITIEANTISAAITGITKKIRTIEQSAGTLTVRAKTISGSAVAAQSGCIWWSNGSCYIDADLITGLAACRAIHSQVVTTPTGDLYVHGRDIRAISNDVVWEEGTEATAAIWVQFDTLRAITTGHSFANYGAGRVYLTGQKLFGSIYSANGGGSSVGSGPVYIRANKVSAIANAGGGDGCLLSWNTGQTSTLRANIDDWDVAGFTGEMIVVVAGTVQINGMDCIGVAGSTGVVVSGGTLRLCGLRVNTAANNSSNPVTKSGGVLVLQNAVLVAEASRDSISAGSAQNVVAMGSWANTAVDADVTITTAGGLTIDADVV